MAPPVEEVEKEKKRKKQFKRMGKILGSVWNLDTSFQDSNDTNSGTMVLCLTDVGQRIDQGSYRLGRHGWEDFAKDLGGVYNWHINGYVGSCSRMINYRKANTALFCC